MLDHWSRSVIRLHEVKFMQELGFSFNNFSSTISKEMVWDFSASSIKHSRKQNLLITFNIVTNFPHPIWQHHPKYLVSFLCFFLGKKKKVKSKAQKTLGLKLHLIISS